MPSPIAHSVTGYVICRAYFLDNGDTSVNKKWQWLTFAVLIANFPDVDLILNLLTEETYHHGFSHSLSSAVFISGLFGFLFAHFNKSSFTRVFLFTVLTYGSHLLLDYFTEGGEGIQLFWPFMSALFISPVTLFPAVHHERSIFHVSHFINVGFEMVYAVVLLGLMRLYGIWKHMRKT